jgi:hypothetical protein
MPPHLLFFVQCLAQDTVEVGELSEEVTRV